MLALNLTKPIAVFDIEATGINPRTDRIVELAVVKVQPDGTRSTRTSRVNPGIPIPAGATKIHGISDEDVAECPTFSDIAAETDDLLQNCDLCGYNITRFDIPMLTEEFIRAGVKFSMEGRRILDVQRIYHRREPRDLAAALSFYCGEMHLDAHGAEPDALATLRVLEGQLQKYPDLPRDLDALDDYCNPRDPDWVDRIGRLKWVDRNIVLNFGKKKGQLLRTIIQDDPGFINWMLKSDFPRDTQDIIRNALENKWPTRPEKAKIDSQDNLG
jgi:DNA polymerase-3 subunit epsilon